MVTTVRLRAEYRRDSSWVATSKPRLSWTAETTDSAWEQAAAEVTLDDGRAVTLEGPKHTFVAWPFERELAPRQEVTARVRVRDADGSWSAFSEPCVIRHGGLAPGEWSAEFLGLPAPSRVAQPFVARRRVEISHELESATLYWSALGVAVGRIDGQEIDDAVLSPGWTTYPDRVLHDSVDVTALLAAAGEHVLGFEVTGGWYTESYGFGEEAQRVYGDQAFVAAQLHLRFTDGTEQVIVTDAGWEVSAIGAVITSGIYAGERVDRRRAVEWWTERGGTSEVAVASDEPATWSRGVPAARQPVPVARISEPVRRISTLDVVDVIQTPAGKTVLDFGQNLVGRLSFEVSGPSGTEIVVRHAEVLEDGELATRPLRNAAATDAFVLSGDGIERFEPVGTFHGFRYAEIEGWPGNLEASASAIRAVVLHSDMTRTSEFSTSHELLQRLHENVVWSMRGNFFGLPTDCPQRDERLGWTGDAQIFAPTAATLFDCNGFLSSWLADLRLDQARSGGVVPNVVPNVFGFAWPAAGWGDAAAVVPSMLAERYGDAGLVADSIDSMRSWSDAEIAAAGGVGLWETTLQFGDWLDPAAPPDMAGAAKTAPGIVATAYLYRSLALLAAAAASNGRHDDAARAAHEAEVVRAAFRAAYITPGGRMSSDAPTAYALALEFGLVEDPDHRAALAARLAHTVKRDAFHISTGFIGTPLVLDALTKNGYVDEVAALLLQTRVPSWLYPVTQGATTVWERWDSMLPDGSINPGEMTSFNHYALGAVVDWMYRGLAGISPLEAGYERIRFAPVALTGIDDVSATIDTAAGRITGGWTREGMTIKWFLTVPAHARAVIEVPGVESDEVGSGSYNWTTTVAERMPSPPPSLWSPLVEIVENPHAYSTVMSALESHDPELADNVRRRTDWTLRTPLAVALFAVPASVTSAIGSALTAASES